MLNLNWAIAKSTFFSLKIWNESYQIFSIYVAGQLKNMVCYLNACFLIHMLSYTQI